TTAVEGTNTYIYAAGAGQPCSWLAFVIAKFDASGHLLAAATESTLGIQFNQCFVPSNNFSEARAITVFNGKIYSAGRSSYEDSRNRPALWKHDPNLNLVWRNPAMGFLGEFRGLTSFGGAIYAVGYEETSGTHDYLLQKYDEAGNRIWSKVSGGTGADVLNGVVGVGSRLFAVGYTTSEGSGALDAVILEIDPANGSILSKTLFGGTQDDMAHKAATDGTDLYVVGESRSFAEGGNVIGQNDIMLLRYSMAIAPTITCPANITVNNDPSQCSAVVNFTVTATGNPTPTVVCTLASGSAFPVGTTTVNCTATNIAGSASCSFTVTVSDNTSPSITAPPAVSASTGPGATMCGTIVTDATLGTATASDNCPGATVSRSGVPAGNFFSIGKTTITYIATDASGNTATATQTVNVIDNTPPTISVSSSPIVLWPPNHKYVTITIPQCVVAAND
ncbi:MAG: HYR domain-containing protein, partial [Bacteroidota bacterium]